MLQGSCYTRGSASLGAQTDISRVPLEDAEVRAVFLHDPFLGSQGTLLMLSAFPRWGEGILRAQKWEWGQGIWFGFFFLFVFFGSLAMDCFK